MPGERRAEHGGHADRVLVDVRLDVLGADRVLVLLQRDDSRFDVEVAAELLPHDVHVAAEHEVGTLGRPPGRFAARAPLPLQRQRAQHDRLGGSLRARAGRLSGRVEEVGEHPDAALLDLRRLRVLGVVDEVDAQRFRSITLTCLWLHPGGDERREVAHRQSVEHHFLADQTHRFLGGHARFREFVVGGRLEQEAVAVTPSSFSICRAVSAGLWRRSVRAAAGAGGMALPPWGRRAAAAGSDRAAGARQRPARAAIICAARLSGGALGSPPERGPGRGPRSSVAAASGISASAATRKHSPPSAVPPLATRALIGSPLDGSISDAIAAAPNATEPSRLSETIRHDSERSFRHTQR